MLYGISQVAQKKSLVVIPAFGVVSLSIVVATPIAVACLAPYVASGEIMDFAPTVIALSIAAATFGQLGNYFYLEAVERGSVSIVGSVTASYPIMVIVVAVVFLSEAPTALQLSGVMVVTSAMIALSYMHGKGADSSTYIGKWFSLTIVAVVLYGLCSIFMKLSLDEMPPLLFMGMYSFVIPPTVLGYYRYKGVRLKKIFPTWSMSLIIGVIASEVAEIGFLCEIFAADTGPASIVFPLVAASPVVVVLLAYAFLKERLTRNETILVALVLTGIVLASIV
jgi:drug/metabolite transporter (DMT)-like permease